MYHIKSVIPLGRFRIVTYSSAAFLSYQNLIKLTTFFNSKAKAIYLTPLIFYESKFKIKRTSPWIFF